MGFQDRRISGTTCPLNATRCHGQWIVPFQNPIQMPYDRLWALQTFLSSLRIHEILADFGNISYTL